MRRISGGGETVERCTGWCTATHANDQDTNLADLAHAAPTVAMRVTVHPEGDDGPVALPILSASVMAWPYAEGADARQPYVSFEASPDDVTELNANEFAAMIAQVRAHADRLDAVHAQLVQAVAQHHTGGGR